MEDAIKHLDELVERIQYGDITNNQIVSKLFDIRNYLEV